MASIESQTSSSLVDSTAPEMPLITPTTSNDASVSSSSADEQITTPRRSLDESHPSELSPQITVPTPTPNRDAAPVPKYNFASLNKSKKTPPSSPGRPNFDAPIPGTSDSAPSSPEFAPALKRFTRPSAPGAMAIQGLRPMTPANLFGSSSGSNGAGKGDGRPQVSMPKSQPLSRALLTKLNDNGSGAGLDLGSKKVAKGQKLIVPKKSFQTTFVLPLTASEFARRW